MADLVASNISAEIVGSFGIKPGGFESISLEILAALPHRGDCPFPAGLRSKTTAWIDRLLAALFPHFAEHEGTRLADLELSKSALAEITESVTSCREAKTSLESFWPALPALVRSLVLDAEAIHYGDPASTSIDEVILTYPGFMAIAIYRIANQLQKLGLPLIPRLLTEIAHQRTGVDLHPAATIGPSFCIDHGTGIVVGATTVIGRGVKLYQGVTLGALAVQRELANTKRHPTLEDNVVVYANATILGGDTVVGHDSVIGGNAWITQSVSPYSILGRENQPKTRMDSNKRKVSDLEFNI